MQADAKELLDRLELGHLADRPAAGLPVRHAQAHRAGPGPGRQPRLLMLDEPANGLTHGEVDELADLIRSCATLLRCWTAIVAGLARKTGTPASASARAIDSGSEFAEVPLTLFASSLSLNSSPSGCLSGRRSAFRRMHVFALTITVLSRPAANTIVSNACFN